MAQDYGRWKNLGPLGGGGQGDVFRVIDQTDQLEGEYALKRLRDVRRLDRFKAEISALSKLNHPSIVRIVDWEIRSEQGSKSPSYLVMPTATEGDLTKRLGLYKGSLEATVKVAQQIASALLAAHQKGIIHRDVKPANILFPQKDHLIWLSDFGISHVPDEPRITRPGEIVGPRSFTAPELEVGGTLEITPAADIYSLGKLLFYMFTGGEIIPREEIQDKAYSAMLGVGERNSLFRQLLSKMIAPLSLRTKDIKEIIDDLNAIEKWDETARALPLTPGTLATIDQIQTAARTKQKIMTDNMTARQIETTNYETMKGSLLPWLSAELEKVAAHSGTPGLIKAGVGKATEIPNAAPRFEYGSNRFLTPDSGVELVFERLTDTFRSRCLLQLWLCQEWKMTISFGDELKSHPAKDQSVFIMPRLVDISISNNRVTTWAYLNYRSGGAPAKQGQRLPIASRSFMGENSTIFKEFKVSEWPSVLENIRDMISASLESFLEYINSGNRAVGL